MQLFVTCSETHVVKVQPQDDVYSVKQLVQEKESVPADDLIAFVNGKPLLDETLLTELEDGQTIQVNLGLKGGKVHGSLARAGKVKGQTPKVEKQEKRKKKTGRAKRRMLYNKRFVNVVPTFGRKRGPNANQG